MIICLYVCGEFFALGKCFGCLQPYRVDPAKSGYKILKQYEERNRINVRALRKNAKMFALGDLE